MIYFTSDTHFGHENIIKFANRPYHNAYYMDKDLIKGWNSVVKPSDIVYHLGDFTLGANASKYFEQLNGYVRILTYPDHHDKRWLAETNGGHITTKGGNVVTFLPPLYTLEMTGLDGKSQSIVLCHYEMTTWNKKHFGAWHLFGHDHRHTNNDTEFKLNVGVEAWDYKPVSFAQIHEVMLSRGWHKDWRQFT